MCGRLWSWFMNPFLSLVGFLGMQYLLPKWHSSYFSWSCLHAGGSEKEEKVTSQNLISQMCLNNTSEDRKISPDKVDQLKLIKSLNRYLTIAKELKHAKNNWLVWSCFNVKVIFRLNRKNTKWHIQWNGGDWEELIENASVRKCIYDFTDVKIVKLTSIHGFFLFNKCL